MKAIVITIIALALTITCKAQWTTGTDIHTTNAGNVGVGTNTPAYKLDVAGDINTSSVFRGFGFPLASGNSTGSISAFYSGTSLFEVVNNSGTTNLFTVLNGGNAGIGTATPLDKLDVNGSLSLSGGGREIHFRDAGNVTRQFMWLDGSNNLGLGGGSVPASMFISTAGYVGLGKTSPLDRLDVNGNLSLSGGSSEIHFRDAGNTAKQYIWLDASNNLGIGGGGNTTSMFISTAGYVGIGTKSPDQQLTVNGSIHAKSVLVDLSIPLPDYVFKPAYRLKSLAEVKAYIDKNQHLAGMPSAAQVVKEGLDLGQMNARLLEKVEELTLYLIEKDKEIKQLEQQKTIIQSQQKQIDELKKELNNLMHKNN